MPKDFKAWSDGCKQQNPDWQFRLWTGIELSKFVQDYYPELYHVYLDYDDDIKRIKMARYLILHKFGGEYDSSSFFGGAANVIKHAILYLTFDNSGRIYNVFLLSQVCTWTWIWFV